jgi:hypothetical protein
MSKYEYFDGELRYHRRTAIWYDLTGTDGKHWYIRLCCSLQDHNSNSAGCGSPYYFQLVYFNTLAEAKRYVDKMIETSGRVCK